MKTAHQNSAHRAKGRILPRRLWKFACGHECLLSALEICQSNFKQPVQISWSPEFCALDDRFLREAWRICECAVEVCILHFADRKPDFTVTRILLGHTLDAKSEFWWPLPCLEIYRSTMELIREHWFSRTFRENFEKVGSAVKFRGRRLEAASPSIREAKHL